MNGFITFYDLSGGCLWWRYLLSDECVAVLIDNHIWRFTARSPGAVSNEICCCGCFIFFILFRKYFVSSQVSKISLVDLAGSERADSTGAKGTRLKVRGSCCFKVVFLHTHWRQKYVSKDNVWKSHFKWKKIYSWIYGQILEKTDFYFFIFAGRSKHQQISHYTGESDISSCWSGMRCIHIKNIINYHFMLFKITNVGISLPTVRTQHQTRSVMLQIWRNK